MSGQNSIIEPDNIAIKLDEEEAAAIEGWRAANNCDTTNQAVRVLLRLGLLSEIAKVYDSVATLREAVDQTGEATF